LSNKGIIFSAEHRKRLISIYVQVF